VGRAAVRDAPGTGRPSGVCPPVVVCRRVARALSTALACAIVFHVATASPGAGQARSRQPITVWITAGLGRALEAMDRTFRDFNASQQTLRAELVLVPEGTYADAARAAGRAGELPCLLFIDGPLIPHFAWLGYIQPIDAFVPKALKADVLPSLITQGSYRGRLYALGIYDSGLGIHANRRHLRAAGVRVPTVDRPWTLAEFEDALARLGAVPGVRYALDLKINYGRGEYFTYAYSPILQSMGGDLIERRTYRRSRGVLDGPQSIAAMRRLQGWIRKGWASATPKDDDFTSGRAALSWAGHWTYQRYAAALGADLLVLPMPDFGHGPRTGSGSWMFTVSSTCPNPADAASLLRFLVRRDNLLRFTALHPGVPGRTSALLQSPLHASGGPLHVYVEQARRGWAVPRPSTPAYPTITAAFADAVDQIIKGADVVEQLGRAAARIDAEIESHDGYP
jgi:multiple sugar transport system substrate-binding protein